MPVTREKVTRGISGNVEDAILHKGLQNFHEDNNNLNFEDDDATVYEDNSYSNYVYGRGSIRSVTSIDSFNRPKPSSLKHSMSQTYLNPIIAHGSEVSISMSPTKSHYNSPLFMHRNLTYDALSPGPKISSPKPIPRSPSGNINKQKSIPSLSASSHLSQKSLPNLSTKTFSHRYTTSSIPKSETNSPSLPSCPRPLIYSDLFFKYIFNNNVHDLIVYLTILLTIFLCYTTINSFKSPPNSPSKQKDELSSMNFVKVVLNTVVYLVLQLGYIFTWMVKFIGNFVLAIWHLLTYQM